MRAYRADRVVRALTALVSFAYFGLGAAAGILLVATPLLKLFAGGDPDWVWGLGVPARLVDADATVVTRWGPARLEVQDVRGDLRLPIAMVPWWVFGVLWTHVAVAAALMLRFLHHLRRIFQRVRDGAPFDAQNALRLRSLGLLLLALALIDGVAELVTSLVVRRGLVSSSIAIPTGLHVDGSLVLMALVLVTLAEIFHRGAELEAEQALVV